jgi:esterase/lipase superfamily enzyme
MPKQAWTWTTPRLSEPARLVRWGHFGTPVLFFPTAGGDFEEIERFHLIEALGELINQGRIKVYCLDGLSVRAWLSARSPATNECAQLQASFDSFVYEEVLPLIRQDCLDPSIEPVVAGASRGAATAIATLLRHPDSFRAAIGVSGIYDPVPGLKGLARPQLERLRQRLIVLASGEGDYEQPEGSRQLSQALAAKNVPCRLSLWGQERAHTWSTWRELFPRLLAERAWEPT